MKLKKSHDERGEDCIFFSVQKYQVLNLSKTGTESVKEDGCLVFSRLETYPSSASSPVETCLALPDLGLFPQAMKVDSFHIHLL